jgi:hypothetical protein
MVYLVPALEKVWIPYYSSRTVALPFESRVDRPWIFHNPRPPAANRDNRRSPRDDEHLGIVHHCGVHLVRSVSAK